MISNGKGGRPRKFHHKLVEEEGFRTVGFDHQPEPATAILHFFALLRSGNDRRFEFWSFQRHKFPLADGREPSVVPPLPGCYSLGFSSLLGVLRSLLVLGIYLKCENAE